jgi:general secretion pathway protein B
MSYILDALKKAEQEREIGRVPGIGSDHEPATPRGPGRWVWVLLGVLLINVLLLAFAMWPRSAVTPRASAPLPARAPAPALTEAAPAVPANASPAVPDEPAQSGPARFAGPGPVAVAPGPPPRTELRPLPPLSEPPQSEPAQEEPAEVPFEPVAVAPAPLKVLPTAPPRPAPEVSYNNLPVWPQISAQLFQELSADLHLDVHVYSEVPQERFVLINMRKYKEGEKLQEGPVVDAITPDSVILSFRGQRFRMQAQ